MGDLVPDGGEAWPFGATESSHTHPRMQPRRRERDGCADCERGHQGTEVEVAFLTRKDFCDRRHGFVYTHWHVHPAAL